MSHRVQSRHSDNDLDRRPNSLLLEKTRDSRVPSHHGYSTGRGSTRFSFSIASSSISRRIGLGSIGLAGAEQCNTNY